MHKIIDNFLSQKDFLNIVNTFFPQDLNNLNNFTWNYQKVMESQLKQIKEVKGVSYN